MSPAEKVMESMLGFTEEDFAELAILAADQAGLSALNQDHLRKMLDSALIKNRNTQNNILRKALLIARGG